MRRIGYFVFFLFVIIYSACIAASADAEEALTWKDCVRQALKNHPGLASAREGLRQAEMDRAITRSALLPQISTEAGGKKSKTSAKKATETYAYSITGKQLLFDGFKVIADIKAATATMTAQEYDYALTSSSIRLNLRSAFVALLRAQQLIALTEEIAERRKQNLDLVRLRYEAGREHKGSLLTAQADLAQAGFELAQAKRNLTVSQRELSKELGRREFLPIRAEGTFDIKQADRQRPNFEYLANTTPFLKELIAKKEAARFGLGSAKSDFFPQVYLNTSAGKTASDWPPENDEWSAGVTVSFPIFEGGERIAKAAKAKSQLKQAREDEKSGRDSVILTLEETWKTLQDAIDKISVQEKFIEAARERARIASSQYSTGLIAFDDWIIIEDNLVEARKDFLNARADLLIAEANWIQAKGGSLGYVQE